MRLQVPGNVHATCICILSMLYFRIACSCQFFTCPCYISMLYICAACPLPYCFSCLILSVLAWLTRPGRPVLAVLFCQSVLPVQFCLGPVCLSSSAYFVLPFLFCLSCPACPVLPPVLPFMLSLSCSAFHVLPVLCYE
jgi:hypothetical protein